MAMYIFGRILFGVYFFYSGFNHFKNVKMLTGYAQSKKVPSSRFAVLLSGAVLVVGGLGFILGRFIPQSSILLIIFLVPTSFMMHAFWNEKDQMARMGDFVNFMKNMALVGALLMLAVL